MKSLYITSVERFSGKTALCLTLGLKLKKDGYQVNYLKPLSLQPWHTTDADGQEHIADEDAAFVKSILDLPSEPWELSPVVITPEALSDHILRGEPVDQTAQLFAAYEKASLGQDILLLEGGSSMREGTVVGLPTAAVTAALDTHVLAIVRYRDVVQVMDDALWGVFQEGWQGGFGADADQGVGFHLFHLDGMFVDPGLADVFPTLDFCPN